MPVFSTLTEGFVSWISDWENWQGLLRTVAQMILILLLTYTVLRWRMRIVRHVFRLAKWDERKKATLEKLLLSSTRYLIWFISIMTILLVLNVPVTSVLAGAGIVGVALGFGAQTLVKDVINGFFIIFDDQFQVGDFVEVNGSVAGTVDELGLRLTKIRLWGGHLVYLPNSEIREVRNYNRGYMRVIATFFLPYHYPVEEAVTQIGEMCEAFTEKNHEHFLATDEGELIEPAVLYGITDIEDMHGRGYQYTITAVVKDVSYFRIANLLRREIVETFQAKEVTVSTPTRQIHYQGTFQEQQETEKQ